MTAWVTGASGMLGSEVVARLASDGHRVFASDIEVDITDRAAVDAFFEAAGTVDWIVNCAAYTAVDAAEDDEARALHLNATGPAVLAEAAAARGIALVHISTDYVFDGTKYGAYLPDDPPAPQSAYGRTKLEGELRVRAALRRHVIIRTAWLYGRNGKNFVATMLRLMNERDEVRVVTDQNGSPTHAADLADAIAAVVTHPDPTWGTFHYTGAGATTWYEFAREIYRQGRERGLIASECAVNPTTSAEFRAKASRPANSVLDCSSFESTFGFAPGGWREALSRYLDSIRESA